MTTEEFIKQLKDLAPSRESLLNSNLSKEYVDRLISSYQTEWRNQSSIYKDPLLRLIDCCKAEQIKIGNIDFSSNIQEVTRFYIIGEVEIDWLVVEKSSGIVKIVEKNIYSEMWECASESSKFLEALLEAEKFFIKRSQDENLYNNREITIAVAEACANAAGGERYLDFYRMFVGSW